MDKDSSDSESSGTDRIIANASGWTTQLDQGELGSNICTDDIVKAAQGLGIQKSSLLTSMNLPVVFNDFTPMDSSPVDLGSWEEDLEDWEENGEGVERKDFWESDDKEVSPSTKTQEDSSEEGLKGRLSDGSYVEETNHLESLSKEEGAHPLEREKEGMTQVELAEVSDLGEQ